MLQRITLVVGALLLLTATSADAKKRFLSGWEAAVGAGVAKTSYHDGVLSPLSGRLGLRLWDHLAVGASGQFNIKRYLGTGYGAFYVNPNGARSLYVRGEYGAMGKYGEGTSDVDAIAYAVGITFGDRHYKLYVEYHHVNQPGWSDALFMGFIWYQRR